jgi:hypothetical protein
VSGTDRTRPGETSSWFRENEASLEAADAAHDRGTKRQAAADLLHDAVDNSEHKAAIRADRAPTDEGLLQSFKRLRWNDSTAVEQADLPVAIDDDLDRLGSSRLATLIFFNVPFAAVGGIFALALRGMPFSISAAIGFIALFSLNLIDGVVAPGALS